MNRRPIQPGFPSPVPPRPEPEQERDQEHDEFMEVMKAWANPIFGREPSVLELWGLK